VRALDDATAPGVGTSADDVTAPPPGVSADDVTAPTPTPTPTPAVRRAHDDATDVAVGPFRLGYRPQLDGVRGIAVLLVLTYHIGAVLWPDARFWLAPGGVLGLDVFFVLSGFLITSLLLDEADRRGRVGLGGFAVRRLRRLVPALVGLSAFLLAISLAGKMYETDDVLHSAPTVFTFTHNWAIAYGWDGSQGHLWSVAVEAQFYLVWAVAMAVAVRLTRRPHVVLAVLTAAGIVAVVVGRSLAFSNGTPLLRLYMGTPSRFDGPLVGAFVAVVASAGWLRWFRGRTAVGLGVAGLAVLAVGVAVCEMGDPFLYHGGLTLAALCAGAVVLAAVRTPASRLGRVLAVRPLVTAGLVSYSLYVWHLPLFEILVKNTGGWSPPLRAVVGLVLALVAAAVSYRLVERPFLRRHRAAR
jgi:peptidoglycan/LPS O-acetylase OafA/YrhL